MKSLTTFSGWLVLTALLMGCAGGETARDEASDPDVAEGELSRSLIAGVAAIELTRNPDADQPRSITIGVKTKVQKVMRAFRTAGRSARCAVATETHVVMFDKAGERVASGTLDCFRGTLALADGSSQFVVIAPGELRVFDEPPAVGDALWGIDKIEVKLSAATTVIEDASDIAKILEDYGPAQELEDSPIPRCMPGRFVTFFRKNTKVAHSGHMCRSTGPLPTRTTATFTIERGSDSDDIRGAIQIDPRGIEQALAD